MSRTLFVLRNTPAMRAAIEEAMRLLPPWDEELNLLISVPQDDVVKVYNAPEGA